MYIVMVASECAPVAKVGGLGDVVFGLSRELDIRGHSVEIILPKYDCLRYNQIFNLQLALKDLWVPWYEYAVHCSVYFGFVHGRKCFFIEPHSDHNFFNRRAFYGQVDDDQRFAFFCRAALEFMLKSNKHPDIIHCHDWQTGLVPAYLRTTFATDPTFLGCRTLFTIHNLGYQGLFPKTALAEVALDPAVYRPDGMEFFGRVSYLKAGIQFADALSTVSPTYAREIQTPEFGFGLDDCLRDRASVLNGILNGVDYADWSPQTDPHIPAPYSAEDLGGKATCKRQLLEEFGLPAAGTDRPLLGMVSRFTRQKGTGILAEIAAQMVAEDVYLVALGEGDPEYEDFFLRMQQEHPGRIAARIGFDNGLAHRIEAGADIFLMPSHYEPCGLNQIYSLHYGTVPVVRATGGLDDTIEEGTGFKFAEYSGEALLAAVRAAVHAFADRESWQRMMRRGMSKDFSWKMSAAAYSALYRRLLAR